MYYADWVGGDIQLKWLSNTQCPAFMADTCSPSSWNRDDARIIEYKTIARRGTWTITEAEWTSWANRMDPDGYIYLRIVPSTSTNANMVITSSAPAEEDPQCVPIDSLLTIEAWDTYEWRGNTYTQSGQYSEIVSGPGNCASTYILNLTIHTTSFDTYTETACDSIIYKGRKYTESAVFKDTLIDITGDRTITTLNFIIHHSVHLTIPEIDAYDQYIWGDTIIERSGTYTRRFQTPNGCDSIVTQQVTILRNLKDTTIYFCPGMHEEGVVEDDGWRIDYRPYQLEKPSPDWYMEGVIRETQADKALVDFRRAEHNLEAHYQPPYVPISNIVWSFRSADDSESHEMEIKDEPQWVEAGTVSLIVRFLCGAPYYSSFTTDVEEVETLSRPEKIMENGTVTIIRGGKRYNVLGSRIQ